ncbi:MAG: bifunctional 4-hydroxy-2-oxoglutarate aldolase/2-dehydro-3-deoxy-phosphogluconate aldolase [Acidobacteriota bacterium]|jgi:2-dehydro-3-deoxyphosphogluconate aldolase/(4S)-4-hydroxy-2-oxoglutarate aldolase|nr:bifunctional 4-hydroxy-2-oxoglutarate aldolase/2-dehydro-3-deoxy-phosphogluconate aldolase [Acidobacteriota bacterium]
MPRHDRLTVWNSMLDTGLVPLFYQGDVDVCRSLLQACADGGARVVEFTNRGDRAWQVFSELAEWADAHTPEVALGVGSIIEPATAALYISSGARFVVGPTLNAAIADTCNRRKIPYLPGCGTVTEISNAEALGCEVVKIFPAGELGGPGFIKSILGPMPWVRLLPTGGVDATEESVEKWMLAGAACLGMGSKLIRRDLVTSGRYGAIADLVRRVLGWITSARPSR